MVYSFHLSFSSIRIVRLVCFQQWRALRTIRQMIEWCKVFYLGCLNGKYLEWQNHPFFRPHAHDQYFPCTIEILGFLVEIGSYYILVFLVEIGSYYKPMKIYLFLSYGFVQSSVSYLHNAFAQPNADVLSFCPELPLVAWIWWYPSDI